MDVLTVLLLLLPPLIFILGLGVISGWFMGNIWTEFQNVPRQKPIWLFRVMGCIGSLGGLVFGYYWGFHQSTDNCGLAVIACGLESFLNGIRSSIAGACLGAILCVLGMAYYFQLQKLCQQR